MKSLTASELEPGLAWRSAPPVIQLDGVSVCYRVQRERIATFKEYFIRWVQRRVRHDEFWALEDVSFEVMRGEVFGIVGRNGAGKSTMLKVISRVMRPTRGRVQVNGRVSPLLELGAGFHHELTGRENIYLNGSLLGYRRAQIDAWYESIVDFAEVWDFIDAPLRTYSSGMISRLGFAVATATQPDILIVDEVLSVGDASFQQKCLERIERFRLAGTTVLVTTHNLDMVRENCTRAVWLDAGRVCALGDPNETVERYLSALQSTTVG